MTSLGRWCSQIASDRLTNETSHPDPFYIREEFAPSDKQALFAQQQAAHNLIAPHLRILQFLASHFSATSFGSPHVQKVFQRLLSVTLQQLRHCTGHPLAREFHFQVVLFGLNVLRHSTGLDVVARWRLKDAILSAGLRWFSHQPRCGRSMLMYKSSADSAVDCHLGATVCKQRPKRGSWLTSI